MHRVEIVVTAIAGDNERRWPAGGDRLFDALIVVDVAGQDQIRYAAGIANAFSRTSAILELPL